MSARPDDHGSRSLGADSASRLHPADLEALAELVADRLAERLEALAVASSRRAPARLLSAAEAAERLGVDRSWIYDHASELGAVRLGSGPRGRLRFDAERVAAALASRDGSERSQVPRSPVAARDRGRPARTSADSAAQLLPIRGRGG